MSPENENARTYRGRSLDELVPLIRRDLGEDAVIVARRETTSGGLAGFFARREIEIDVVRGGGASRPAPRAFADELAQAHDDHHDDQVDARVGRYERRPPAPAHKPVVAPEVDALPSAADVTVDDLFPAAPRQAQGLAALFAAGTGEPPAGRDAGLQARPPEPPSADEPPRAQEPRAEATRDDEPRPHEPPAPPVPPAAPARPPALAPAAESVGPVALPLAARGVAERLTARGLRAELAEAIAEEGVASLLPLRPDSDPAEVVVEALARRIPVHPLRRAGGVVGFVGPGGAGKTLTTARLAAAHARHGSLPVTVLALRSPDGGAELTRLLAPYGVALHAVESGAEGSGRIASVRDGVVIIDTPGVSPRAPEALRYLANELEALAPDELHLTVPATIGPDAARELVRGVRELGVAALVVSHADETEQLGTVVGLAIESGLPLSYLACGQAVDAGLRPAEAGDLASKLAP